MQKTMSVGAPNIGWRSGLRDNPRKLDRRNKQLIMLKQGMSMHG